MLTCALAGLHAGIVGIVWMFGCFVVAAFWNGVGIWSIPNLMATVFYGDIAFDDEFLRTTWAGLALMVVFYGLIGAIWGCIWKGDRKRLLAFYGALTGLAVYFVSFHYIWPRMNPLLPLHEPVRQLEVAHILWGAALSRSPGYVRKILAALAPPVVFEAAATPHVEAPHVVAPHVAVHDVVDGEAPAAQHPPVQHPPVQHPPAGQDGGESVSGEAIR